jgi:ATP-dependent DNA ligase
VIYYLGGMAKGVLCILRSSANVLAERKIEPGFLIFEPLNASLRTAAARWSFRLTALVLSRAHWVRPEMVVEVSYAEWTPDGLLRHVVYLGEREDKPAIEVRRDPSHSGEPI